MIKLDIRDITAQDNTILRRFHCGVKNIDSYLKNHALSDHNSKENVTKLVFIDDVLVACYALKCDTTTVVNPEMWDEPRSFPSVNIDIFAVASTWQRNAKNIHVGTVVLAKIVKQVKITAKTIGCRFITVHALNASKNWYINKSLFIPIDNTLHTNHTTFLVYNLLQN